MQDMVAGLAFYEEGIERLKDDDPELFEALNSEAERQAKCLVMVASSSVIDRSVHACEASVAGNVTAEGYPGNRYHAGCGYVDVLESLAITRARSIFKAQYANVQPHSASTANLIVLTTLLAPGDTLLGMELSSGGHLTHGSKASFSGRLFNAVGYGLTPRGFIDYDNVARLAHKHRPKLIICGATAYSRIVDFQRFREIADDIGAYLLADVAHVAGLIAADLHPSPIDYAHVTTTCTHKQLYGPRGGLILIGRDATSPGPDGKTSLAKAFDRAVFPVTQGAPHMSTIAAKARALQLAGTETFRERARRILENAEALACAFMDMGYKVVSDGTSNHIVLLDLSSRGISGLVAEKALEECHIIVNKNHVPGDRLPAFVTSGVRLGTNTLAYRGFTPKTIRSCACLIDRVLSTLQPLNEREYEFDRASRDAIRRDVHALAARFPILHSVR